MKSLTQRREAKPDGSKQRGGRMFTLIGDFDRITGLSGWEQGGKVRRRKVEFGGSKPATRANATVAL